MFSLAHFSDVHLGPLPPASLRSLAGKRLIGFISWNMKRKTVLLPHVAHALLADIHAHQPDHIAITGDLVNIALPAEFLQARAYLEQAGPPDRVSLVPGNHDAYVAFPWNDGIGRWADYMTGDMRVPAQAPSAAVLTPMPYVRIRRNVALVGVSTAIPQGTGRAGGTMGPDQIKSLAAILPDLKERGFCRVVMIHHPPLPGMTVARKALTDAAQLAAILARHGAELVLHGHNHTASVTSFAGARIFGVPAASSNGSDHLEPAGWNLYQMERRSGRWQIRVTRRAWDSASGRMGQAPDISPTPSPLVQIDPA